MTTSDQSLVVSEKDLLAYDVQAWQKSIDVQQHFNNLEMQIRNFAITVLAGVIGAAAVVFKDSLTSARLILSVGLIAWIAFFLMDYFWYHKLLIGAVRNAQGIEDRLKSRIPGIGLSGCISEASRLPFFGGEIHSSQKMIIFYGLIALVIIAAIVLL